MTIADMLVILKERLSKFTCSAVNEQLIPHDVTYLRYDAYAKNWADYPAERIRVSVAGVETLIFPTAYTVNSAGGYITFSVARISTDIIIADYQKKPFTDAELTSMLESAVKQVRVLTFHRIDDLNISVNYSEAIKRTKKNNITLGNIGEIMLSQIPSVSSSVSIVVMIKYKTIQNLINCLNSDKTCLNCLTTNDKNGKARKISKTSISNIIKFLVQ